MIDQSAIIDRITTEHHSIRNHVRLVGDSLNDIEALFSLQRAHAGWTQASVENLSSKKLQLQQALSQIDEGLRNHFAYEEKSLESLFGQALIRALKYEHREIITQIEAAKAIAAETKLEELEQGDKLSSRSRLQQAVSSICQSVEQHAALEEQILKMLRKSLEG